MEWGYNNVGFYTLVYSGRRVSPFRSNAVGMVVPVIVYQYNIVVLLSLNESKPACHLLPAL